MPPESVNAGELRGREGLEPPESFSARSSDPAQDELRYAEPLLRRVGARNEALLPTADGLMAELDSLLWHMDEPFQAPSVYGQRKVHELARREGTVVLLDGNGGDEALSGYHHFHYPALLVALLRRGRLLAFASEVRARRRALGTSPTRTLKDVVRLLLARWRRRAGRPDWLASDVGPLPRPVPGISLAAHQDFGLSISPLPAYNHHSDRNSMTFSLETRNPFLDYRVVEAGRALRTEDLLHEGYTKWALREGVRDLLPGEIVDRAEKQGFTTDEADWFRHRLLDELGRTFASESLAARGYFDRERLLAALSRHGGGQNVATELWRAYVVERWLRLFVDPAVLTPPAPAEWAVPTEITASANVVRPTATAPEADEPQPGVRAPLRLTHIVMTIWRAISAIASV